MADPAEVLERERTELSLKIEALASRWAGLVEAAARRYGLDGFERDDLMQRVRVRLWRALERQRDQAGEISAGYAYRAAVSAAIDMARERRAQRMSVPLEAVPAGSSDPGASTEAGQLAAIDAGLERLDPPRRVAVRLHLAGCTVREIANLTGWNADRARNLLYRGLSDLRQVIEEAS